MKITYEKQESFIKDPVKGNKRDSGHDLFTPEGFQLSPGQRITVNLGIKFHIEMDLRLPEGIGIEAQIRPKSGRSKSGIDVELGTVDEDYRGFIGVTVTNINNYPVAFKKDEKICQVVFAPVFNNVELVVGEVSEDTDRGAGGFGSTGLSS